MLFTTFKYLSLILCVFKMMQVSCPGCCAEQRDRVNKIKQILTNQWPAVANVISR